MRAASGTSCLKAQFGIRAARIPAAPFIYFRSQPTLEISSARNACRLRDSPPEGCPDLVLSRPRSCGLAPHLGNRQSALDRLEGPCRVERRRWRWQCEGCD
jgi:hypothetical protein